jgi:hypothetical protein
MQLSCKVHGKHCVCTAAPALQCCGCACCSTPSACVAAAGSDPDSLEFAGGLMQRTLLEVAAAADDLVAIFGVGQREPASLFTVWAARQVRTRPAATRQAHSAAEVWAGGVHGNTNGRRGPLQAFACKPHMTTPLC